MKQKWTELKGEIDTTTTIGIFNTPLSITDKTKQKTK